MASRRISLFLFLAMMAAQFSAGQCQENATIHAEGVPIRNNASATPFPSNSSTSSSTGSLATPAPLPSSFSNHVKSLKADDYTKKLFDKYGQVRQVSREGKRTRSCRERFANVLSENIH